MLSGVNSHSPRSKTTLPCSFPATGFTTAKCSLRPPQTQAISDSGNSAAHALAEANTAAIADLYVILFIFLAHIV